MTSDMSGCEWMFPETAVNFEEVPLQYKGVCGWTLVQKKGLIVPGTHTYAFMTVSLTVYSNRMFSSSGNPHLGVLKHREKFYAFSSRSAAYEFASRADECITAVTEMAKTSAELIQLLHLHQEFACVTPYAEVPLQNHTPYRDLASLLLLLQSPITKTSLTLSSFYLELQYVWIQNPFYKRLNKKISFHQPQKKFSHPF